MYFALYTCFLLFIVLFQTLIEKQISQLQIQIRTQEESIKVLQVCPICFLIVFCRFHFHGCFHTLIIFLQSEGGDVGRTQTELQYLNNKLNMLKLRRKQQKPVLNSKHTYMHVLKFSQISSEDETKQLRVRVSTLTAELFGERNKISDFELEISSLNEMVEKQKCDCESAASSAVRYKSMYMQLLDALEVEGVTVHVDGFGEVFVVLFLMCLMSTCCFRRVQLL